MAPPRLSARRNLLRFSAIRGFRWDDTEFGVLAKRRFAYQRYCLAAQGDVQRGPAFERTAFS